MLTVVFLTNFLCQIFQKCQKWLHSVKPESHVIIIITIITTSPSSHNVLVIIIVIRNESFSISYGFIMIIVLCESGLRVQTSAICIFGWKHPITTNLSLFILDGQVVNAKRWKHLNVHMLKIQIIRSSYNDKAKKKKPCSFYRVFNNRWLPAKTTTYFTFYCWLFFVLLNKCDCTLFGTQTATLLTQALIKKDIETPVL